jgi:hypothetical protein
MENTEHSKHTAIEDEVEITDLARVERFKEPQTFEAIAYNARLAAFYQSAILETSWCDQYRATRAGSTTHDFQQFAQYLNSTPWQADSILHSHYPLQLYLP